MQRKRRVSGSVMVLMSALMMGVVSIPSVVSADERVVWREHFESVVPQGWSVVERDLGLWMRTHLMFMYKEGERARMQVVFFDAAEVDLEESSLSVLSTSYLSAWQEGMGMEGLEVEVFGCEIGGASQSVGLRTVPVKGAAEVGTELEACFGWVPGSNRMVAVLGWVSPVEGEGGAAAPAARRLVDVEALGVVREGSRLR